MIRNPNHINLTGLALKYYNEVKEGKIIPKPVNHELRLTFHDDTHLWAVNGILKEPRTKL